MKPVRATLETMAMSFLRPPARSSISAHSVKVRWSFHSSAREATCRFCPRTRCRASGRQADGGDLGGLELRLFAGGGDALHRCIPPVVGSCSDQPGLGEYTGTRRRRCPAPRLFPCRAEPWSPRCDVDPAQQCHVVPFPACFSCRRSHWRRTRPFSGRPAPPGRSIQRNGVGANRLGRGRRAG